MIDLTKARAQLRERVGAALIGDPACGGRVCTGTLDWIADEATAMARAVERKLIAHVEALGGGCDANSGGAHSATGNPPFCTDCGLMLKRVVYVLPHVAPSAARAAMVAGNGRLTDSSAKPSVLSKGAGDEAGGSVASGNGKDASGDGCDG